MRVDGGDGVPIGDGVCEGEPDSGVALVTRISLLLRSAVLCGLRLCVEEMGGGIEGCGIEMVVVVVCGMYIMGGGGRRFIIRGPGSAHLLLLKIELFSAVAGVGSSCSESR